MGNCTHLQHRSARQNLSYSTQNSSKASLVITIKTWPKFPLIKLIQPQHSMERQMNINLYTDQKMQFTLKSQFQQQHSPHFKQIQLLNQNHSEKENLNFTLKCELQKTQKMYVIRFPDEEERKQVWRYIWEWNDLQEGDVIRLGLTKFKLCKYVSNLTKKISSQIEQNNLIPKISSASIDANRCRICLSSIESPQNPLISPCKCTGTIKYIHIKCLSTWLFNSFNSQPYITIRVNKSMCQLCKTDITNTPYYQQMKTQIMSHIHNAPKPYAVFQTFLKQQTQNNYFIISFYSKDSYTMGRSSKADVCDSNDTFISKINSQILCKGERLFIRDLQSTHGTLLRQRNEIKLYHGHRMDQITYHNMLIKAVYNSQFDYSKD